jgi:hypothetical protein
MDLESDLFESEEEWVQVTSEGNCKDTAYKRCKKSSTLAIFRRIRFSPTFTEHFYEWLFQLIGYSDTYCFGHGLLLLLISLSLLPQFLLKSRDWKFCLFRELRPVVAKAVHIAFEAGDVVYGSLSIGLRAALPSTWAVRTSG